MIKTPNLVAGYRFEGNANDWSGNGNHGTVYGASLAAGKFGQCYSFNGVDNYINCGNNASLAITTTLSISLWAKLTGTIGTDNTFMVSKKNTNWNQAAGYQVYYSPYNNGIIDIMAQGSYFKRHTLLQDYNWHHYAIIWEGTTLSLYQDAQFISGTYSGTPASVIAGNDALWINKRDETNIAYSKSIIDEVRIYNRALTESEIRQGMLGYEPGEF